MASLVEAEFLAPSGPRCHRHRQRQAQHRLLIAEHDERLMEQWRKSFPGDVWDEEAFYAAQREERRADRRRRRAFFEKVDNPNMALGDEDPRWDDLWTEATSDDK
jgi:hypothetical protein